MRARFSLDQFGVMDAGALNDTDIRLFVFFVGPEVAEHFATDAINGHAVFPGLGHLPVLRQDDVAQGLQTAFVGFFFLDEIFVES